MENTQPCLGGWEPMRAFRTSPRSLLLIAAVAVLLLALLSDFQPRRSASLSELPDDGAGAISAVVVRCRPCAGGQLLNLTDGEGGWADAFCPAEVYPTSIANGTSVQLVVQRSASDPAFLYVQRVTVTAVPTGND